MKTLMILGVTLVLAGCTSVLVRAKCGPDGANDYYPGRLGFPTHIACDGPIRKRGRG